VAESRLFALDSAYLAQFLSGHDVGRDVAKARHSLPARLLRNQPQITDQPWQAVSAGKNAE